MLNLERSKNITYIDRAKTLSNNLPTYAKLYAKFMSTINIGYSLGSPTIHDVFGENLPYNRSRGPCGACDLLYKLNNSDYHRQFLNKYIL